MKLLWNLLQCLLLPLLLFLLTMEKNQKNSMVLRVCLYWGKMISGNHFPPNRGVWQNGKFHFPENGFLLTEIFTFDPEMILHPHFHFKSFSPKTNAPLNNIIHIFIHFFIHTYFKKLQTTILKLFYQTLP